MDARLRHYWRFHNTRATDDKEKENMTPPPPTTTTTTTTTVRVIRRQRRPHRRGLVPTSHGIFELLPQYYYYYWKRKKRIIFDPFVIIMFVLSLSGQQQRRRLPFFADAQAAATSVRACTVDEITDDNCELNGTCQAADGTTSPDCSASITDGSADCFDCDPCQQYSGTSCEECTAATEATVDGESSSCHWCPHSQTSQQYCVSRNVAVAHADACLVQSPGFVETCPSCNYHADANDSGAPTDTCHWALDGECDEGPLPNVNGETCGTATDCFDCDACRQFDFSSCETCVNAAATFAGCTWCAAEGRCFGSDRVISTTKAIADFRGRPYRVTCGNAALAATVEQCTALEAEQVFDTVPLYHANQWVYDLIHVEPVWRAGITGAGIGIRFNDGGIDPTHPDLISNDNGNNTKFVLGSSCNTYLPLDADDVSEAQRTHGTSVAAISTANHNNDTASSSTSSCAVGIAPDARYSSCRVVGRQTTSPESTDQAYLFLKMNDDMHISNNSFERLVCRRKDNSRRDLQGGRQPTSNACPFLPDATPCATDSACTAIDWTNLQTAQPVTVSVACEDEIIAYCSNKLNYEQDAAGCIEFLDLFVDCYYAASVEENSSLIRGIAEGRQGKGIVYVWAAGNFHALGDRVEQKSDYVNTRLVISVGAVGKDGRHATYSATGTSLFVSAPGGDLDFFTNIVTAKAGGGCHHANSGTSFAAPVVSGVVALVLQVNPDLTWRDVKGVLATTAFHVHDHENDPYDDSWVVNGAGIWHSDRYGFGIVNASAAVMVAETWQLYSPEFMLVGRSGPLNITLPEYTAESDPVVTNLTIAEGEPFVIESVYLFVRLDHSSRGDLKISLTSPMGTVSVVHPSKRPENNNVEMWKFVTHKVWGESPYGAWTLSIEDESAGDLDDCVDDSTFYFVVGDDNDDGFEIDCRALDLIEFCQDGGNVLLGEPVNGPNDPRLVGTKGMTPGDACCSCNGGTPVSEIVDMLQDWTISVYGRDRPTSSPTNNPSSLPTTPPTFDPSASPSGDPTRDPDTFSSTSIAPPSSRSTSQCLLVSVVLSLILTCWSQ